MQWETVIGLEIHTQLATRSKIFSGAPTAFGAEPNTQACAVDLGLPGVLPVLNKEAVTLAVRFGKAIDAEIAERSIFARKNYFYPDLPKGYQISQYELPVVGKGRVEIVLDDGAVKQIGVTRAHLEEDAGKSLHEDFHGLTGIDLNRAGTPLLEIVSEPDMRSPEEAVAYAKKIHQIVRWIGISDGNMQEGSFRVDANVSVRPEGRGEIRHPRRDQEHQLLPLPGEGHPTSRSSARSTSSRAAARWSRRPGSTTRTRTRPAPCAPRRRPTTTAISRTRTCCPLAIDDAFIDQATSDLPELPDAKRQRFRDRYGLSDYDANLLTASRDMADYYEAVADGSGRRQAGRQLGQRRAGRGPEQGRARRSARAR